MLKKTVLLILTAVLAVASSGAALAHPASVATVAAPSAINEVAETPVAPELPPELHCPAAIKLPTTLGGVEVPASLALEGCFGCELNPINCLLKEDCSSTQPCDATVNITCLLRLAPYRCACIIN